MKTIFSEMKKFAKKEPLIFIRWAQKEKKNGLNWPYEDIAKKMIITNQNLLQKGKFED